MGTVQGWVHLWDDLRRWRAPLRSARGPQLCLHLLHSSRICLSFLFLNFSAVAFWSFRLFFTSVHEELGSEKTVFGNEMFNALLLSLLFFLRGALVGLPFFCWSLCFFCVREGRASLFGQLHSPRHQVALVDAVCLASGSFERGRVSLLLLFFCLPDGPP